MNRRSTSHRHIAVQQISHAALETLEQRRMLAASDLDPTFGSGGSVVTDVGGSDFAFAVAVQPWDGRVLAVGSSVTGGNTPTLVRYSSGGAHQTSLDLGSFGFTDAIDVEAESANRFVVVGVDANQDFIVARFLDDLTLDPSFNGGNVYQATNAGATETAQALAIASDGGVVVGGFSDTDMAVLRLDASGIPVVGFGTNGFATIDVGSTGDVANGVALQSDGTVVLAGHTLQNTTTDYALVRVDASGVAISTDVIQEPLSENLNSVVVAADDSIYATGSDGNAGYLRRYTAAGVNIDTIPVVGGELDALGIALDGAGNLLIAGIPTSGDQFSLTRMTPAGAPDGTFGTGGNVQTPIGSFSIGVAVAAQADGKILVAGMSDDDFAVARYGVFGSAPVADAGGDQTVNEGDTVNFDASSSTGSNLSYAWDLDGDGGFDDATGPTASWVYDDNYSVNVSVQVTDDQNNTDTDSLTVQVNNVAPSATVNGPATAIRQVPVTFGGSFTDPGTGDTHEVAWNFGDGNTIAFHDSNDANALTPTHTYTTSGTYLVTFSVRDDDNGLDIDTMSITVSSSGVVSGTLYVGGTSGNDNITVDRQGSSHRVFFGTTQEGSFSGVTRVVVLADGGNDFVTIDGNVNVPTELYGGSGIDLMVGGGGKDIIFGELGSDLLYARGDDDVLVGGDGSDALAGGSGRDVLIGGLGADALLGSELDDILVAGWTSHDTSVTALSNIRTEWAGAGTYPVRVARLQNGTGSTGVILKDDVTAFDDGVRDVLSGGSGRDWFIANTTGSGVTDLIIDASSNETSNDLG